MRALGEKSDRSYQHLAPGSSAIEPQLARHGKRIKMDDLRNQGLAHRGPRHYEGGHA